MDEKQVTLTHALSVLNRIHALDPTVMPALIGYRVPCNDALAADPTVQVGSSGEKYEVGLLGILNGLFGVDENDWGFIYARFDKDKNLIEFTDKRW